MESLVNEYVTVDAVEVLTAGTAVTLQCIE